MKLAVQGSLLLHQGLAGARVLPRRLGGPRKAGGRIPRAGSQDERGRIAAGVHGGRRPPIRKQQGKG